MNESMWSRDYDHLVNDVYMHMFVFLPVYSSCWNKSNDLRVFKYIFDLFIQPR